jgi:hypothetical protein
MKPPDIKELYTYAIRHPRMEVKVIRGPDRVNGQLFQPVREAPAIPGCPEASLGALKLRTIRSNQPLNHRVCGGVDHWYAIDLKGGDVLHVRLAHAGQLRVELFGIRGISAITSSKDAIHYKVPLARRNRGARYLRVTAPGWAAGLILPYTLTASSF